MAGLRSGANPGGSATSDGTDRPDPFMAGLAGDDEPQK